MNRGEAIDQIRIERLRQIELWGEDGKSNPLWLTIITEELGEVAEAILDLRDAQANGSARQRHHAREHLLDEITQVAATAVAWLEDGV